MAWEALSRRGLQVEIDEGLAAMSPDQKRLWAMIAIPPVKWKLPGWGDQGGGFWVVGIYGQTVIWYNVFEQIRDDRTG